MNKAAGVRVPAWVERWLPTIAATYRRSRVYRWVTHLMLALLPVTVVLSLYVFWQQYRHDPRRQAAGGITLVVAEHCPYSRELERALQAADIRYRQLNLDAGDGDGAARWAFYTLGARGVPVTVVGSEVVPGLRTGAIRDALARAGHDTQRLVFEPTFERAADGGMTAVRR
jgi:glutaredoxin